MLRVGTISALSLVPEHAENSRASATEAGESFALESYSAIWPWTRKSIINDDLGAFADWTSEMARHRGRDRSCTVRFSTDRKCWRRPGHGRRSESTSRASHGNLASPGTAIDVTSVAAARHKMREAKGLGGVFPVAVAPVAILTSPARELAAEQVVVALTPNEIGQVNPFSGKLRVEVEQRLSGNAWYLCLREPGLCPCVPQSAWASLSSREGFDILGIEFRCLLDFAVGVRISGSFTVSPARNEFPGRYILSAGE